MCIFIVSTEHPDYRLVLLDNRDERWDRPTARAHWWPSGIFAPQDLAKPDGGTWMGSSINGRIAVLVNISPSAGGWQGTRSRGKLPADFLRSTLQPDVWINEVRDSQDLGQYGAFVMLIGIVMIDDVKLALVSNLIPDEFNLSGTFAVTNGGCEKWPKTDVLLADFESLKTYKGSELLKHARQILQTPSAIYPSPHTALDLKFHVFVSPFKSMSRIYGTRTSTVLLCDRAGAVTYDETDVATSNTNTEQYTLSIS